MTAKHTALFLQRPGTPRMNLSELVNISVSGQIAHPEDKPSPYRIGTDGVPRILPGTGGIVLSHRVGDRCVGLAGDHVEPAVSIKNQHRSLKGEKDAFNLALNTYSCIGNTAVVLTGDQKGKKGVVTGKHGGINNVLIDFPRQIMQRLKIGDQIQINAYGTGLRLIDHPHVSVFNCAPKLIQQWGIRFLNHAIQVPVTHLIPAALMGSGLGRNNAVRGDYDIQMNNPELNQRLGLNNLRFGDFVAIIDADTRYGRSYHQGVITVGIVVHSDSTVSGHGPGVVTLLSGDARYLRPIKDRAANLAVVFRLRELPPPRSYQTHLQKSAPSILKTQLKIRQQKSHTAI